MVRKRPCNCAFWFYVASLALPGPSLAFAPPETRQISIDISHWEEDAGTRAAGMLCLPNGRITKGDLQVFAEVGESRLNQSLDASFLSGASKIVVILRSSKFRLCAKRYGAFGLGSPNAFTGTGSFRVTLQFWADPSTLGDQRECSFDFERYKKISGSIGQIFADGLSQITSECRIPR